MGKESSQRCCGKGMVVELQNTERQQANLPDACAVNEKDGPNISQRRNGVLSECFTAKQAALPGCSTIQSQ
ncbi:hypothetical protein AgCh_031587 [Apium graveolens]